ncbi:MAG: GNAT family N-acetyltransferase [Dehalococcoidia bacterium]
MPGFFSRSFTGESDIPLLHDFARQALAARSPGLSYWHPGDVTWQLFGGALYDASKVIHLWLDADGVAGLAWLEPPLNATIDVRPGMPDGAPLLHEVLAWCEEQRRLFRRPSAGETPVAYSMLPADGLTTVALESDPLRLEVLAQRGYERAERFEYRFQLGLDSAVAAPALPPGAVLRHVTEPDIAERVDLHRDAWSVWGESSVTAKSYRSLRKAPGYDPELDIVLELEGRLVSYCICWADRATGTGVFEPVGTRPSHTGRGFARAVTFEGLRRLRERGMVTALVGTASVNERAATVYQSCGFELVERAWCWSKVL